MFLERQVVSTIMMRAHLPQRYLHQHKLQAMRLLYHKQQIVRLKMDLLDHTTQDLARKFVLQNDFKTLRSAKCFFFLYFFAILDDHIFVILN